MPRLNHRTPKYRKHKPTGQAVVTLDGRDFYLGKHGTAASRREYDRLIAEWLDNGRRLPSADSDWSVTELAAAYWRYAKAYYVKDGKPTDEVACIKGALRHLRALYGPTHARDFGPIALKAVRQRMIDDGWSRDFINKQVGRLKRCFKWGVANEHIPAANYQALIALDGLKRGRSQARETAPVMPVPDETVDATLDHLNPVTADLVRFQRLTGCRPGEAYSLRPCDLDRTGEVWFYRPASHKTEHRDRQRTIVIGPRAQAILRPYLLRDAEALCFVPPRSRTGRYGKESYRNAIHRACNAAFPATEPLARRDNETLKQWHARLSRHELAELKQWQRQHHWNPNQLRHSTGTAIRKRFGLEAVQTVLGHAKADVTQVYAERDLQQAARVMKEVG